LKYYFAKHYKNLKYTKDSKKTKGLRNAQIGAIHAVSSFFTVNRSKAAIVVMPTGSGKGFDFPNLKIAAIHAPHKSLASTFQFIGRFARTNAKDIGTAKFIALNDEELEIENNRLYVSDAIWQDMIINMSEDTNICRDR